MLTRRDFLKRLAFFPVASAMIWFLFGSGCFCRKKFVCFGTNVFYGYFFCFQALRSHEGNEAQVCFFIIQLLLLKPNEFRTRVNAFIREVCFFVHVLWYLELSTAF